MSKLISRWPSLQHFKDGKFSDFLSAVDSDILVAQGFDYTCLVYYKASALKRIGSIRGALDLYREVAQSDVADPAYVASSLFNLGLWSVEWQDFDYSENCLAMYRGCQGMDANIAKTWELTIACLKARGMDFRPLLNQLRDFGNIPDIANLVLSAMEVVDRQVLLSELLYQEKPFYFESPRFHSVAFVCYLSKCDYENARLTLQKYRSAATSAFMELKAEYFDLMLMHKMEPNSPRILRSANALLQRSKNHNRINCSDITQFCSRVIQEHSGIKRVLVSRRHGMIGESPQLEQVREQIDLYANSDLNVLIRGASGTGKELVAIAMHQNSRRRDQSFVPVNCFHLGTQLAEARLFGHRKGAFTGAAQDAPGFVHEAHGGTLFLDEIGELPLEAQANLFRFLDSGQFRRVGSTELEKANVRVIAATNQDLSQDARFRHELYHRLGTVVIDLPPLAERGTDVLHIARCRVAELNVLGGFTKTLSLESERKLGGYDWPGNVRELLNVIDRAWHASSQEIAPDVLRFDRRISLHIEAANGWVPDLQRDVIDLDEAVNRYTARLVQEMHARCNRDAAETARRLNISERTVYRWIKRSTEDPGAEAPSA